MKQLLMGICLAVSIPCSAMDQLILKKMEEGTTENKSRLYQLVWAVLFERPDKVDRLLADGAYACAVCNQQLPSGKTVLHLAVVPGHNTPEGHANRMHIVRALLAAGVSADVQDNALCTAAGYLDAYGDFEDKQEMRDLLTGQ